MKLEECLFLNLPPYKKPERDPIEDEFGELLWQRKIKNGKYKLSNGIIKQKFGVDLENLQPTDKHFLVGLPTWYMHLSPILDEKGNPYKLLEVDSDSEDSFEKIPESQTYLLSPITNTTPISLRLIGFLRQKYPKSQIIVGGPQATYEDNEFLKKGADIVVRGEGEQKFREIVQGKSFDLIHGISFKEDGQIVRTPSRDPIANLDELPLFNWSNMPPEYNPSFYRRYFAQRGCPMNCCFCADALWVNQKIRKKSLERIEMEARGAILNTKFIEYHFSDNCFSANKSYANSIAEIMGDFGVDWTVETRVDMVDKDSLNKWARNECVEIEYGGESAVNSVLGHSNKRITKEQMVKAFEITKETGINVHTNWMVGLPWETKDMAVETIDFVCDMSRRGLIDTMDYFIMVPYPGSPVARDPKKFGIAIISKDWRGYNEDVLPIYESKTFSRNDIFDTWKFGIERFVGTLR